MFFFILMGLGTWQIQRLYWKEGLLINSYKIWNSSCLEGKKINTFIHKMIMDPDLPKQLCDRCITLKGHFIPTTNLFLQGKTLLQKNKNLRSFLKKRSLSLYGVEVMTLFKTEDGDYLWINRGWAPLHKKIPMGKFLKEPTCQKISLYLKHPSKSSIFSNILPKNIPNSRIWYTPDLKKMSEGLHVQASPFFYGIQISKKELIHQKIEFPVPQLEMLPMQNNHLTYAFIWYSLGACSLLIYGIYHRRHRLQEEKQTYSLN